MKKFLNFLLLLLAITTVFSCTSQKKLIYLQGDPAILLDTTDFTMYLFPNDIISVDLYTVNPDAFPGIGIMNEQKGLPTDNRSAYEKGFVLDDDGFVSLPYIGRMKLAGLTMDAANDSVTKRFQAFIEDPVIVLKKLSFKVSLVGEFNRPGLYYIPNEKLSLLEAMAMAGDLNNFADRTKITIYRKTPMGVLAIPVDITQVEAFTGATKYIYPDDIIYAQASKKKAFTAISPATAVISSALSTTVLIIALILDNNKN